MLLIWNYRCVVLLRTLFKGAEMADMQSVVVVQIRLYINDNNYYSNGKVGGNSNWAEQMVMPRTPEELSATFLVAVMTMCPPWPVTSWTGTDTRFRTEGNRKFNLSKGISTFKFPLVTCNSSVRQSMTSSVMLTIWSWRQYWGPNPIRLATKWIPFLFVNSVECWWLRREVLRHSFRAWTWILLIPSSKCWNIPVDKSSSIPSRTKLSDSFFQFLSEDSQKFWSLFFNYKGFYYEYSHILL